MFDSGITAKELIDELKTEVDIAIEIPDSSYVSWLDSLQQLLYSEIIKEQKEHRFLISGQVGGGTIIPLPGLGMPIDFGKVKNFQLSEIDIGENESQPRFEDIHAFYFGGMQLIKSTVASGKIFPFSYFKKDDGIVGYNDDNVYIPTTGWWSSIIYFVRPALIKDKGAENANVMLPIEFIDLAKAKLRGEAYKLANEDALAAKWLNDYNILLENFKAWIADKSPNFGL